MKIGLISDTHGLMRPEALDALKGVERILHAGDVGTPEVLDALERIAPTTAVRGNVDRAAWADALPMTEWVECDGVVFYMIHILEDLDIDPGAAGVDVVLYGHSHKPAASERDGVLYLNPGSAGPRRFSLPISMAYAEVASGVITARHFIDLEDTA